MAPVWLRVKLNGIVLGTGTECSEESKQQRLYQEIAYDSSHCLRRCVRGLWSGSAQRGARL